MADGQVLNVITYLIIAGLLILAACNVGNDDDLPKY